MLMDMREVEHNCLVAMMAIDGDVDFLAWHILRGVLPRLGASNFDYAFEAVVAELLGYADDI